MPLDLLLCHAPNSMNATLPTILLQIHITSLSHPTNKQLINVQYQHLLLSLKPCGLNRSKVPTSLKNNLEFKKHVLADFSWYFFPLSLIEVLIFIVYHFLGRGSYQKFSVTYREQGILHRIYHIYQIFHQPFLPTIYPIKNDLLCPFAHEQRPFHLQVITLAGV